jgi:methylthioribose-1-phosphate isomerase
VDLSIESGSDIPIEQRDSEEVTSFRGIRVVPAEVGAFNPAFDVTPHELVSAIITDRGVARAPFGESLARLNRP